MNTPPSLLSRLSPFPRTPELRPFLPGLRFSFFNALTWQIAIGTPLILLIEALGGSSAQAGLAYSFIFLLTPIQLAATLLLPRVGYRQLTLRGWSWRTGTLLVPLAITASVPWLGPQPWMLPVLVVSVFIFCLLRSMGKAASVPWFLALIPAPNRGTYFGSDHLLAGLASLLTLGTSVLCFATLPTFPALFLQYVLALAGSWLAVQSLRRLPDVAAPPVQSAAAIVRGLWRLAWQGGAFSRYFVVSAGCYWFTTPLLPFLAYHLRADQGLATNWIMALEGVRYLGSVAAATSLRQRVDRLGARPFLLCSLFTYVALSAAWALYASVLSPQPWALLGTYLLLGAASTAWMVGNLGLLPKLLPEHDRMLGVTLHSAGSSFAGGLATVVWGWILKSEQGPVGLDPLGFCSLFAAAGIGGALLFLLLLRIREPDTSQRTEWLPFALLLRPHRALASLIQLPGSAPDPNVAKKRSD